MTCLSLSNPPSLLDLTRLASLFYMLILSEKSSCKFVPEPDPGLGSEPRLLVKSRLVTFDATILFQDSESGPAFNVNTPMPTTNRPTDAKETSPNNPRPNPEHVESFEVFLESN
jgi:hypothetical protein